MRTWLKIITLMVWAFLVTYLAEVYGMPRNIYYIIIVGPILFGGAFLIYYLFDKIGKNDKTIN